MKSIRQILPKQKIFSFEIFPPKTPEAQVQLFQNLEELEKLRPDFISVTMGAMGSNQRNTFEIVEHIQSKHDIAGVAHLTCIGASKNKIRESLEELRKKNIIHLLCLRGDPPKDPNYVPPEDGFHYANELVEFIRKETGDHFTLGIAAYPEAHIESPNKHADLINLKRKVDAGADFMITQLFFNNEDYFNFLEKVRKAGIKIPVLPGIMPVTSYSQLSTFTKMCGAKIPDKMSQDLLEFKNNSKQVREYGIAYAIQQCKNLLERGAPGLHFYILNQPGPIKRIYEALHLPQ